MIRLPAEWERHRATWLAWPENESDWLGQIEAVRKSYLNFINELTKHEVVELLVSDSALLENISFANAKNLNIHSLKTNRSWLRDSAPTAVFRDDIIEWVHWDFNAWAKYDDFESDRNVPGLISEVSGYDLKKALRTDESHAVMEGGVFDSNGEGTLLVTEECLLSEQQVRNPGFGKKEYQKLFRDYLGIEDIIWLKAGVPGDDTHGHIDDVCRFVEKDIVVLAVSDSEEDEFKKVSDENRIVLSKSRNSAGERIQVIELPMPKPIIFQGDRLPASYANFYIANEAVYVPEFKDRADENAFRILEAALPGRCVIPINCVEYVLGLGTLHCSTQQEPKHRN